MKKFFLFFTVVFLIGATVSARTTNTLKDDSFANNFNRGYGNSFIFTEGGIEFSVFPDGQFDFYAPDYGPDANVSINTPNTSFSFNSGYDYSPYLQYDDFGAIIQVENTPIYYDYYGRVIQIGNVDINYTNYGRVALIGGLHVYYNSYHTFTHYSGFINSYNTAYIYRPWHSYYAVPAPNYCIVYARPYRQYYTPVRYHYYRPYINNYREPVRYSNNRTLNNSSSRRGTVASANITSDRYRQEATLGKSDVVASRGTSLRTSEALNTRSSLNDRTVRSATPARATNRVQELSNDTRPTRTSPVERTRANARDLSPTTQRSSTSNRTLENTQIHSTRQNTNAISQSTERVNNLPNRKPNISNTRISNTKQQQRNTVQRSSSQKTERTQQQPSSQSTSRRNN